MCCFQCSSMKGILMNSSCNCFCFFSFCYFALLPQSSKQKTLSQYQDVCTSNLYWPGQCLWGHPCLKPIFFFCVKENIRKEQPCCVPSYNVKHKQVQEQNKSYLHQYYIIISKFSLFLHQQQSDMQLVMLQDSSQPSF